MSRIALVASLAMFTTRGNLPLAERPLSRHAAEPETFPVQSLASDAATTHRVVWRPDPHEGNPFSFIPNDWNAQPQLLPLTWDVETIFASPGRK